MTAPDSFLAQDQALVARIRLFFGHIEDMSDDERVFMLGALAGALERRLAPQGGSVIKDPEAGDHVTVTGTIISVNAGTALVEVYRSDPPGIRVPVQCGALEHIEVTAGDGMPPAAGP